MNLLFATLLAITANAQQGTKLAHTLNEYQRDYAYLCEIAKMNKNLLKLPEFKDHKAELAVSQYKITEIALVTTEAKNAVHAIAQADLNQKGPLLHRSAAEVGLKNWKCPAANQ